MDSNNQDSDEDIIKGAHANWLQHSVTKAAFQAIEKHKLTLVAFMADNATNVSIPSEVIRLNANALKTCNAIVALLSTPENFKLSKLEQLKTQ